MAPYSPPIAHYAHITLEDMSALDLQRIVGRNGRYLYTLTSHAGLKYIWMDFENKRLELWGSYNSFLRGAQQFVESAIVNRIST